jgi:predicted transcriptional regulator
MIECAERCAELDVSCPITECRCWIDYEEDLNCVNIAIKHNGAMKLREIAERLSLTPARVQQIEKSVLAKLKKLM